MAWTWSLLEEECEHKISENGLSTNKISVDIDIKCQFKEESGPKVGEKKSL